MFGLKADWSHEVFDRYFTIGDYAGGEARWCPGCGDHAVLSAAHRVLRDEQQKPELSVCVSGIGCSSRMPHYMGTYGFHGLHGRALPVACGIKSRRPELDVWVATGDGDCFSIGAGHWIHAIRYNMNMVVMVFDNAIYGLTKAQTSPTTPAGFKTNTHPTGAIIAPHNPLTITLGITNASFVAQVVDWNPPLLYETLKAAYRHRGTSFVRIIQRCPVFSDKFVKDLQNDPSRFLLLEHEQGIAMNESIQRQFPERLQHDPSDLGRAFQLAADDSRLPVGLLYCNPAAPRYEDFSSQGADLTPQQRLTELETVLDRLTI
ncbi:2-oxoglutarate oxidoreductase [Thiorhodococcus mannitoliphagus]|uniref:2-oxoglutarate oxidoreductase n=1 Tax=Thiorhodococcus mannitoliphagus TaxID=329406 RepID=A0A6P1DSM9_9GAMM|nr:thiamine pyrophosphate-dependent enzyme [Thiorhodococcus mannitoliphagus]NEX20809.1 2-oxoglutarate oxidoreductase [Thiorhodococcus mannitoliphagus]